MLNGDIGFGYFPIILKGHDQSKYHLNLHLQCILLLLSWPYHNHQLQPCYLLVQHVAELHPLVCEGAFSPRKADLAENSASLADIQQVLASTVI